MKKKKAKMVCYKCKNCDKTVYFLSDTEYDTKCKTCETEMQFMYEKDYNPKNGLRAIRSSNIIDSSKVQVPIVECPYCHSTNTEKITNTSKALHTAMFGIFSISRNAKQWHCNDCKSDF